MSSPAPSSPPTGFGTFAGVYTPTLLTILGVIMYLRFGWVVGNLGLVGALGVVLVSHLITGTTAASVASIATNRTVRAGGAYYMISRSLGVPAGAAIGVPLFLGQALGVTFYIVGFSEAMVDLLPLDWVYDPTGELGQANTAWVKKGIGSLALLGLTALSITSASVAMKAQYVIMGLIALSLVSVFGQPLLAAPNTLGAVAPDFGQPTPTPGSPPLANFSMAFAIFFPAVTGIMTGVGMSGDLANPRRSIPLGTGLAVITGLLIYLTLPVFLAYRVDGAELRANNNILWDISAWSPLVYLGLFGATLSSALGTLLVAPRTLQALGRDRVLPGIRFFASGAGPSMEPRRGLVLTFVIAEAGILLGNLDAIAGVLTMFMLATYGFTNLACGLEKWADNPSFRPSFPVRAWVSISGAVACLYVMSILDLRAMFGALAISAGVFYLARKKELGKDEGNALHGIWAALVRTSLQRLRASRWYPQNWRPNLLIFGGWDKKRKRQYLLELGSDLVGESGVVTYAMMLRGNVNKANNEQREQLLDDVQMEFQEDYPNVFFKVDVARDVYDGMVTVVQAYGIGSFEANTVMLGWSTKDDRQERYGDLLWAFNVLHRSMLIVSYKSERGFGDHKQIQVWCSAQGNRSLMFLVAHLLQSSTRWKNATITIFQAVRAGQNCKEVAAALHEELGQARIEAYVETPTIPESGGIRQVMSECSADADLAIIGTAAPESRDHYSLFFARMGKLLEVLPTTMIVQSARDFDGEQVLFDSKDTALAVRESSLPETPTDTAPTHSPTDVAPDRAVSSESDADPST